MTRPSRQQARRAVADHRERQQHARGTFEALSPQDRARRLAWAAREARGYVPIRDLEAHYLCDLGLGDRGRSSGHDDRAPLPAIIRTNRQTGDRAA